MGHSERLPLLPSELLLTRKFAAPFGKVAAAPFGKFGSFPFAAGFGKAVAPVDFKKFGTLPVGKVAPVGKVVAVEKAVVAAPVAAKKVVGAGFDVFPAGPFLGAKSVVPGKKVVASGFGVPGAFF